MDNLNDLLFLTNLKEISESEDSPKPAGTLGKVRGQFFALDSKTRNNRFYPKDLWLKAVREAASMLEQRQMLGTIGHEQELDDKALLEGRVSHVITKLFVDDNGRGIGEALILDTPAGKVLNSYLKAGVTLGVSSRAFGEYSGKTSDGADIVNPDTYKLEGFDFVRNPGLEAARASIVESNIGVKNVETLNTTSGDLLESLAKDKVMLQQKFEEVASKYEEAKTKSEAYKELAADRESRLKKIEEELESHKRKSALLERYKTLGSPLEISKALGEAFKVIKSYKRFGSPSRIQESFDKLRKHESVGNLTQIKRQSEISEDLSKLGSPEEIRESLTSSYRMLKKISKLGRYKEIKEALQASEVLADRVSELGGLGAIQENLQKLRKYRELATIKEIKEANNYLSKYAELGNPKQFSDTLDVLEGIVDSGLIKKAKLAKVYEKLGSPAEISKVFKVLEEKIAQRRALRKSPKVAKIAEEFRVRKSVVASLVEGLGFNGAKKFLKDQAEKGVVSSRYRVDNEPLSEVIAESQTTSAEQSRIDRMFSKYGR